MKRTELQCMARGCDGCVVCDRENYTLEQLAEYRKLEINVNRAISKYEKSLKGKDIK